MSPEEPSSVAATSPHPLDRADVDALWTRCAAKCGFNVVRSGDAYASNDGRGVITVGTRESLDPDDCLAVLILHELCHGFVQGTDRWGEPDFGLDNTDPDEEAVAESGDALPANVGLEYAALRMQAALADRAGLRALFFSTTVWRPYYEDLPPEALDTHPLDRPEEAWVIARARQGLREARKAPYAGALRAALKGTAEIAARNRLWSPVPGRHPVSGPMGPGSCGDCAWRYRGRDGDRCRVHHRAGTPGPRVRPDFPGCLSFERPLDCQTCGACCREAFHGVEISRLDPFVRSHPDLVFRDGRRTLVARRGGRCANLEGDGPYGCTVYDDRPGTCRDFTRSSDNCLIARRRVGLAR